jgi:hypothetical protein
MSLQIRIKKGRDGPNSLACIRADRSHTIHYQTTDFFAFHDLTHYAVETTLNFQRGFFGLVTEGWSITDFGNGWPRGPLPAESLLPEMIVGRLDIERGTGVRQSPDGCKVTVDGDELTEEQLERIRKKMHELHEQWRALEPGGTIELEFPERFTNKKRETGGNT